MTSRVLAEKGVTNRQIACTLGVGESLVRYYLKRAEQGAVDGRSGKPRKADALAGISARLWWDRTRETPHRPPNVLEFQEMLVREHGYWGSFKSVTSER